MKTENSHLESIRCNLCGSKEYKIKFKPEKKDYDLKNIFSTSKGIMYTQQIVECKRCGLVYVNPRIKERVLRRALLYDKDELYVSQADLRKKTFKKYLKVINRCCSNKGELLDVGCASGFFMDIANKDGWDTYGVEPSRLLADYGIKKFNLNIKNGFFMDVNFKNNYFDLVTMWDVLEHTLDPSGVLKKANRIMKKDAVLIINFPDIGTFPAKFSGKRWWFLLSHHFYYFSVKTLSEMLQKAGFEFISSRMHWQTLSTGYIVKMLSLYNRTLSSFLLRITNRVRLSDKSLLYYAGQTNMVAKKI